MTDLADLTAVELLAAYAGAEASPVDAVQACLDRIALLEPRINAIATLVGERCLEGARASTDRWAHGEARALEGVPYGLKDLIQTAGVRTAGGSRIYAQHVPSVDSAVAERLAAAGGLLLAKLHTFELARGDDSWNGPTRNPWDLSRSAGASSAGAAAALAARELPVAVGTDSGGSIRVPAAVSGVTGLKPTYGRVPTFGVMPQSWTLDHVGPLARTVEDCALLLSIIAGHDFRDPKSLDTPISDYVAATRQDVAGLRIGVPTDWFFDVIDAEAEHATHAAIDILRDAGAIVREVRLPHAHLTDTVGGLIIYAEFASFHEVHFDRLQEFGIRYSQQELVDSQFVSATDYLRALRTLHLLQHDFEEVFEHVEALVVPGMVGVAPASETLEFTVNGEPRPWIEVVARMTLLFNLVGIPALALPAGFSSHGLPLGIQVAARPLNEDMCFRVGGTYQRLTNHHHARPPLLAEGPGAA